MLNAQDTVLADVKLNKLPNRVVTAATRREVEELHNTLHEEGDCSLVATESDRGFHHLFCT